MSYEIDRYALEQELGRGAFGAVYLARHTILGTRVALKLLHSTQAQDPDSIERFLREARAAASIGNPHIVRVSDAGITANRQAFLAMELLEGEDLASYLGRRGRLTVHDAIDITRQVLDGLAAAHDAGIVHRDMKPANVFLTPGPGGAPFAKLLDFGVSKMARGVGVEGRLTATGTIVGTPHYMAPEQLMESRSVDGRADLYSVGVMLYELLSGRLPHDAESFGALVGMVLTTEPIDLSAILPDVPPAIAAATLRALAKDPAHRFQTAREMSEALRRCLDGSAPFVPATRAAEGMAATLPVGGSGSTLPLGGVTGGPMPAPAPPRRRSMLPFVLLGAVLLACPLALGIAGVVMRERVGAAWSAFVGAPASGGTLGPSGEPGGPDQPSGPAAPPEIPMHDGTEEIVGVAGISVERGSRRRAENGRWIVDVPITIRNVGEAGLTFQQSELAADGYIPTAESDLPTFAMVAANQSFDGYMVWRASEDIADPQTITVRFRGWARRVPVTDGPRLPPRPPPGGAPPE